MPQHDLHTRLQAAIAGQRLFAPDDTLIVAVSGGADSVALLDLLTTLPCYTLRLIVAHLNHQLRGTASDADERFVRELAARYGLPCEVQRVSVRQLAKAEKLSLEEAGRAARYTFFEQLRRERQATAVVTAHHADDQAETLLLRLLRGAGITGLAAMEARTETAVVRPLLSFTRDELRGYLAQQGLTFREDASNQDRSILRNRIRHELLPLLEHYGAGIAPRLAATSALLRQDEQLLEEYTQRDFRRLASHGPGWCALPRLELLDLASALRMRLYRQALKLVHGDLQGFERRHTQALDELLIAGDTGTSVNLPRRTTACRTAGQLLIAQRQVLAAQPVTSCAIAGPGCYDLGNGLSVLVEQAPPPDDWRTVPPTVAYIDPEQAPLPWLVRPPRPGDRLSLGSTGGSCRIKELLIDSKFPRHLRPNLPLLIANDQPLWLAGVKRSALAQVRPGQPSALRLTLHGRERMPLFP